MLEFFARLEENHNVLSNFEKCLKMFDNTQKENRFLMIFGKVLVKNGAFGNNITFLQQIVHVRWDVPAPPGYATDYISH